MMASSVPENISELCKRTLEKVSNLWDTQDDSKGSSSSSLASLRRRLTETPTNSNDSASRNLSYTKHENSKLTNIQASSFLYDNSISSAPPLKKPKSGPSKTLGKGWFDIQPTELDASLQRDAKLIQLRNYLDPKRFYKNPDKGGKILHVGTIIEGPTEYFSSRLTKKERHRSILEEVLHDTSAKEYTKKTYLAIQKQKSNKKKFFSSKKFISGKKKSIRK